MPSTKKSLIREKSGKMFRISGILFTMLLFFIIFSQNTRIVEGVEGSNGSSTGLQITLGSPSNNAISYSPDIQFSFSVNLAAEINCTLFLNGNANQTVSINSILSYQIPLEVEEGSYLWNVSCSNATDTAFSETRQFYYFDMPTLTLEYPQNIIWMNSIEVNFSFSLSNVNLVTTCSLILDNGSVATMSTHDLVEGENIFSRNISQGAHNWLVSCNINSSSGEHSQSISTESRMLSIDSESPQITILSPQQNYFSEQKIVNFTLLASDNLATVLNCIMSIANNKTNISLNSNTIYQTQLTLSKGNFSWNISCEDYAKNKFTSPNRFIELFDFNISTDKQTYSPNENVLIYLSAPNSSRVNLSVFSSASRVNYLTSPPYPTTYIFTSTSEQGNYTIDATIAKNNSVVTRRGYFSVVAPNALQLTIDANSTLIEKGDAVRFTSVASGNTGILLYRWDFNDDGVTDSTLPNAAYTYSQAGSYSASLNITDSYNSLTAEKNIKVLDRFNLFVNVKDSLSNPLESNLSLGNLSAASNSVGNATFSNVLEGNYTLTIRKDGYENYDSNIILDSNKSLNVYLESLPLQPSIIFISPEQNSIIGSTALSIKFKVLHFFETNCTFYLSEQGQWWVVLGNKSAVQNNTEQAIDVKNLKEGSNRLKIVCNDAFGNSNSSKELNFSVDLHQAASTAGDEKINKAIADVGDLKRYYESMPPDYFDVASQLGILKQIDDAEALLERANRDLNDLTYSRKTEAEIAQRRNEIINDAISRVNEIPTDIRVLDYLQFVKYPQPTRINEIAESIIASENLKVNTNVFVTQNSPLQQFLTISTKTMNVELSYENGSTESITFVTNEISFSDEQLKNAFSDNSSLILVLLIPKNITQSADDIAFFSESTIIKSDPIIEFPLSENIRYYFNSNIDLKKIEDVELFLVQKASATNAPGITGYTVVEKKVIWPFNLLKGKFQIQNFTVQLIIIISLLAIYLVFTLQPNIIRKPLRISKENVQGIQGAYSQPEPNFVNPYFGTASSYNESWNGATAQVPLKTEYEKRNFVSTTPKSVPKFITRFNFRSRDPEQMKSNYLFHSIEKAKNSLARNSYEEAASTYYELRLLFSTLPEQKKAFFYPYIISLWQALNLEYMHSLISNAKSLVETEKQEEALAVYKKMEDIYKMLPVEHKSTVFMECLNIANRLNELQMKNRYGKKK